MKAAQEMMRFATLNLDNAYLAYQAVLEIYQAGKERIAEVSTAQKQLAIARVRYSEVKTHLMTAIANLAYATGTLQPQRGNQCVK